MRCLLSEEPAFVDLVGYGDLKKIMQYRLAKEAALRLASTVSTHTHQLAGLARFSPWKAPHTPHGMKRNHLANHDCRVEAILTEHAKDSSFQTPVPTYRHPCPSGRVAKVRLLLSERQSPISYANALAELASPQ